VVSGEQEGRNAGPGKAHHPFPPFALIGGRGTAVFVSVPRKYYQVNPLINRGFNNRVQRFKKVCHAQEQPGGRVVRAASGDIDMRVGKVQYFYHKPIITSRGAA